MNDCAPKTRKHLALLLTPMLLFSACQKKQTGLYDAQEELSQPSARPTGEDFDPEALSAPTPSAKTPPAEKTESPQSAKAPQPAPKPASPKKHTPPSTVQADDNIAHTPDEKAVAAAATGFLTALKTGDVAGLLGYFPGDVVRKDPNIVQKVQATFFSPILQAITAKTGHRLLAIHVTGLSASVDLSMEVPDMKVIESEIKGRMLGAMQQSGGSPDKQKLLREMAKVIEETNAPLLKRQSTMHLKKEKDGWKVTKPPQ